MYRFFVYSLFIAFLSSTLSVFSSPVSTPPNLEKRGYSGRATFFYVGLGACGERNVDSDWIVALATSTYNHGSHCNKKVIITDVRTGKTAQATVRDECPGCGPGDLDMSPSLFSHFENQDKGVFSIKWSFE